MKSATKPTIPTLQPHHGYESWSSTWRDSSGRQRMKRFGRAGIVTKRAALSAYQEWLANEWTQKEHVRNPQVLQGVYTVDRLCDDYLAHAGSYYRKEGKPTSHFAQVRIAIEVLRSNLGRLPANDVRGPMINKMLNAMIRGKGERVLARQTINDRLKIIQQAFTWAHTTLGKVSAETAWSVSAVDKLKAFRTDATERREVMPVDPKIVEATIGHCSSVIADMIQLQQLSGMRPQEVCIMRGDCLKRIGPVLCYRPSRHKTQHHGTKREIFLGPQAMLIVERRMASAGDGYLFRPEECGVTPGRKYQPHYSVRTYRQAIERACRRAFPFAAAQLPKQLRKLSKVDLQAHRKAKGKWDDAHAWHPNQLRHAWATRIRERFGVEAARIGLGHSDLKTTEIYAQRDRHQAIAAAAQAG